MAIAGDLRVVFGTFASYPKPHHRHHSLRSPLPSSKVHFGGSNTGLGNISLSSKWLHMESSSLNAETNSNQCFGVGKNNNSSTFLHQDAEGFLLNVINMSFLDRLRLAWKILFPKTTIKSDSNAGVAKQRLKMILFSDRCAVSDEAKQKIVSNIVKSLSEFVEIDSQDKVQLSVSADGDLGTVYSVTVPVRRVKPEYQDSEADYQGKISSIKYNGTEEASGTVDVTFDFFMPNEK